MNNKNLVLILIIFCVITLFLNMFNTFNKSRNSHILKDYKNEKINKIVSSNKIAIISLNGIIENRPKGYKRSTNRQPSERCCA